MHLQCDQYPGRNYVSNTQKARVISENWFATHGFCLSCAANKLERLPHNTKVRDFLCSSCGEPYELKSTRMEISGKIPDGAYSAMMDRIKNKTAPTIMLMSYSCDWRVRKLLAVHRLFLTANVIEKRRPLNDFARRSGWQGCNIVIRNIPLEGRIAVVDDGKAVDRVEVRRRFQAVVPLAGLSASQRGWTSLTLLLIRELGKQRFSLADLYAKEAQFGAVFPNNRHLRPKIRQQAQILRDSGLLIFEGKGMYRLKER